MKYANFCGFNTTRLNIGEPLQYLTVANLYHQMGIRAGEIVNLNIDEVMEYDGEEELLLPLISPIANFTKNDLIAISPKIKPVFLATYLHTMTYLNDVDKLLSNPFNLNYFFKHSPIGCRDEATYKCFKQYNIPAYINGCLTVTLPKITNLPGKAVVLADAPKDLLPFIPREYLNAETLTASQQCLISPEIINDYDKLFEIAKEKYKFYIDNAKLIITSRLHVALPCAAFGIPVILAKDVIDTRFSFLEKYFPVYDRSLYSQIDWNPKPINLENQKNIILKNAIERIKHTYESLAVQAELTAEFESRQKTFDYVHPHISTHNNSEKAINYIKANWKGNKVEYALWGATDKTAHFWKQTVEAAYPQAKLAAIFDKQAGELLLGMQKQPPENLLNMPDLCVFVCAVGAVEDALNLFNQNNIKPERYCITADQFISMQDLKQLGD